MTLAFPESDRHFARKDGYQAGIIDAALPYCRKRDLAIDVGAHVGLISRKMLKEGFKKVVAVEPQHDNRLCLIKNLSDWTKDTPDQWFEIAPWVLSDRVWYVTMKNPAPENSGAWEVSDSPNGRMFATEMLDNLDLGAPDLVKYDIQGHEIPALKGSKQTLMTYKPVVIVECWRDGERDNAPKRYMEELGARCVQTVGKDLIFAWEDAK